MVQQCSPVAAQRQLHPQRAKQVALVAGVARLKPVEVVCLKQRTRRLLLPVFRRLLQVP